MASVSSWGSLLSRRSTHSQSLRLTVGSIISDTKQEIRAVIWLIGGPASGKSTQAKLLSREFGLTTIEPERLVRRCPLAPPRGAKSKRIYGTRCLANDTLVDILDEEIYRNPNHKGYIMVDFPQRYRQGHIFESRVAIPCMLIHLKSQRSVLQMRLMQEDHHLCDCEVHRLLNIIEEDNKGVIAEYPNILYTVNADQNPRNVYKDIKAVMYKAGIIPKKLTQIPVFHYGQAKMKEEEREKAIRDAMKGWKQRRKKDEDEDDDDDDDDDDYDDEDDDSGSN